ncbi:hypothetical protein BKA64DRAFT_395095 [Cadophora sp. MPI-SDFR-AT-0126]|nr:hypothetical protein BKA64DRAFT_395095 [Leotiomycetes sp. MPI-SDFR-AT-0126]
MSTRRKKDYCDSNGEQLILHSLIMTSRQAKQTGEKAKQHRRRSTKVGNESKNSGHLNEGTSATYQEQPESPQQHLSQASQTSQYQYLSSADLPPSTTWPTSKTVPNQSQMNQALLGLTSFHFTSSPAQHSYFTSPYSQTRHQCQHQYHSNSYIHPGAPDGSAVSDMYEMEPFDDEPPTGYGMTAMRRWSAEQPSQQGGLLAWEEQQDEENMARATRWGLKRL